MENGSTSIQEQEQEAIETVLDETKRAIKKTVSEAKREIPKYTEAMAGLQEETIQATKEIGYNSDRASERSSKFNSQISGKVHVILCPLGFSKNPNRVLY